MTPELIQGIAQLGFAAAVAAYLVYYQTTSLNESIKANTKAVVGMQLIITELYYLMLTHDAQVRAIPRDADTDSPEYIKAAANNYAAAVSRLDQLKAQLQQQMVSK